MVKLLSTIILVLTIILFPPAVLALVSNNAVPGDATYPIKITLENGIFAIASLNSTTKAWFSAARSDRRFKEIEALTAQGRSVGASIEELVLQTEFAAEQINQVNDPIQKQQLIEQYSQTIEKYDEGLKKLSVVVPTTQVVPAPERPSISILPSAQPTSKPTLSPTPPVTSTPVPAPNPTIMPKPTEQPNPTSTSTTIPTSTPTSTPITSQTTSQGTDKQDIDEARDKLKKIKDKLKNGKHQEKPQQDEQNPSATQSEKEESVKKRP